MRRHLLAGILTVACAIGQSQIQFVASFPPSGTEIDRWWEFNGTPLCTLDDGRIYLISPAGPSLIGTAYAPGGDVKAGVANGVLYYADTSRRLNSYVGGVTRMLSAQQFVGFGDESADADGVVYFLANDGAHGWELWRIAGPNGPLSMVADQTPGSAGTPLHEFTTVGRKFFCLSGTLNGVNEVWEGTASGLIQRTFLSPGSGISGVGGFPFASSLLVGSRVAGLAFRGWSPSTPTPSLGPPGTWILLNMRPPSYAISGIPPFPPCEPYIQSLTSVGSDIYCAYAQNDICIYPPISFQGRELLTVQTGSHEIAPFSDPAGLPYSSDPDSFVDVNGTTCFLAWDSTNGRELRADFGRILFDSAPGAQYIPFIGLTNAGGLLGFTADGTLGIESEPWFADPINGSHWIIDINPGPGSSYPSEAVLAGGWQYMLAYDGTQTGLFRVFPGATAQEVGVPSGSAAIAPWLASDRPIRGRTANVRGTYCSGIARVLLAGSRAATPLILPGDCYIYLDIGLPILTLQTATQAGDWS